MICRALRKSPGVKRSNNRRWAHSVEVQKRLSLRTLFAETVRDISDCDDPAVVCGRSVGECVGDCGAGGGVFCVAEEHIGRFVSVECNAIECDPIKSGSAES